MEKASETGEAYAELPSAGARQRLQVIDLKHYFLL